VQHAEREGDRAPRVVDEKGVQQGIFGREEEFRQDSCRIVIREIDIVEMNEAMEREARKHFENEPVHLASRFDRVRGIDKEEVPRG
jgi:hypothetical protein